MDVERRQERETDRIAIVLGIIADDDVRRFTARTLASPASPRPPPPRTPDPYPVCFTLRSFPASCRLVVYYPTRSLPDQRCLPSLESLAPFRLPIGPPYICSQQLRSPSSPSIKMAYNQYQVQMAYNLALSDFALSSSCLALSNLLLFLLQMAYNQYQVQMANAWKERIAKENIAADKLHDATQLAHYNDNDLSKCTNGLFGIGTNTTYGGMYDSHTGQYKGSLRYAGSTGSSSSSRTPSGYTSKNSAYSVSTAISKGVAAATATASGMAAAATSATCS
eukprot:gene1136-32496_t